ncbi:MAG: RNA-binding cell elongation regulator Jag/EloR [Ruminococcus sp.]|jgi:spoIIIJ-associated protein|nr:RNA-binding cell elongation regulator Jag/EloR [Ruminococcus sp.]
MIKEVIGTGENEQLALENAKAQLGLADDADYDFEVIQRPEKKVLGLFGGKQAKVKLTVEVEGDETVEEPKTEEIKKQAPAQKPAPKKSGKAADTAEKFLKDVISAMGLENLEITSEKNEDSAVFDIEGEDVGYIIGRRGETLDALQYLTSLVANHVDNSYFKITVNTGNYREKREKTLEILGRKLAFKAIKTGKKTSLEPMNPYERRIIHTSVQKVRGAISWSEGENANRHVVIGPDPKSRGRRGGGYNRRGGNRPQTKASQVNPDRKPLDESNGAGLYGRIT